MSVESIPLNFKLYIDGELEASFTTLVSLIPNYSTYVCLGYGPFPWRIGLVHTGEMIDGWHSFRAAIDDAAGSRATEMLPFLIYAKPAEFPSVLVAPCRWPHRLDPPWMTKLPPRVFVVTVQHPDPIGAWDHDAGDSRTEQQA